MSYYVESDGDRTPKDVYVCESDGGRILTMECASEDRRFRLARQICKALNGKESPDELTAKLQTQIEWWQTAKEDPHGIANAVIASLVSVQNALRDATTQKEGAK